MQLIIFIEILFAPIKFKLDTNDIIISSVCLAVFCLILALYFKRLLKTGNNQLAERFEKSNMDFIYSINSVLVDHASFSNKLLKNYGDSPSEYLENISRDSKTIFGFAAHYKNEFIQNRNIFYELNKYSYSSYKLLKDNYIDEMRKAVTTYKYYDLEASLMKEKIVLLIKLSNFNSESISNSKSIDRSGEIKQLTGKLELLKNYLDKYSYLIETSYSNYETLGNLKIDDLRYEVQLIIQQLFDTYHNYGNTIYSLLNRYYSQLNISLTEFYSRSDEYVKQLSYHKLVSEIRKKKDIDDNAQIVLVNVIQDYRDIIALRSNDSKADFYILKMRNDINLYPVNVKSGDLYIAFDLDVSKGTNKVDSLEPAVCRKISDKEYKIINKGIIRFL
ncbi:MAG: hypothetical protein EHM58_09820 [Ignavibacteriae bacterium]|nr:MAG: hypothetical protein EHM58_09820 [Ignavibacteriota bacterium]